MSINPQTVFASGLLLVTMHDVIKGFSLDIFAPILEGVIPGNVQEPMLFGKIKIYPTRFMIRLINVLVAIAIVRHMKLNKLASNL